MGRRNAVHKALWVRKFRAARLTRAGVAVVGAVVATVVAGSAFAYVVAPGFGFAQGDVESASTTSPAGSPASGHDRSSDTSATASGGSQQIAPPGSASPGRTPVGERAGRSPSPVAGTITVVPTAPFDPQGLCATWPDFTPMATTDSAETNAGADYPAEPVLISLGGAPAGGSTPADPATRSGASPSTSAGPSVIATPADSSCPAEAQATVSVGLARSVPPGVASDGTRYPATMTVASDGLAITFTLIPNTDPANSTTGTGTSPSIADTSPPPTSSEDSETSDPAPS